MKLGKIKSVLLGTILCLSSLVGCNSKKPLTKVTLTEAGAARINAVVERQTQAKKRLLKYSSWLTFKDADILPKRAKVGDEVGEETNFEIYPSDFSDINALFLIGRNNADVNQRQAVHLYGGLLAAEGEEGDPAEVESLVEITTNIPSTDINDYSLNGQVSYINGSGDINHDRLDPSAIEYQEEAEVTMTYTYIKKGTAADTSPYSCQPSFHVTKVDNDAPAATTSNELMFEASYTQTAAQLRAYLATEIGRFFTIKDSKLTKTVNIEYTDAELETAKNASIAAAKADSENHQFTQIDIPFTVSTENASTEILHAKLDLVDDVLPAVYKNGAAVNAIQLNGGTNLKMVHYSTVNSGAKALLASNGYTVEDEIEGAADLDFKWDVDGYLVATGSYNNEPVQFKDLTTKFNSASTRSETMKPIAYETSSYTHTIKVVGMDRYPSTYTYEFNPANNELKYDIGYSADEYGEIVTGTEMVWIIDDLHLNDGTPFEELMTPASVELSPGFAAAVIVNSSAIIDNFRILNYSGSLPVFINTDCIPNKSEHKFIDADAEKHSEVLNTFDVHLTSAEYDQSWYYRFYNRRPVSQHIYFAFKLAESSSIQDVNYNYTLAAFKAKYNIEYAVE